MKSHHDASLKRLFFGAQVIAPWPHEYPKGRIIDERSRHLTLAFLGETAFPKIHSLLSAAPTFPRKVGIVGKSDRLLFLPEESQQPRVVAYHIQWLEHDQMLRTFQKDVISWLESEHFHFKKKENFLSHVTLARDPLHLQMWHDAYQDLPFIMSAIHLYESIGNLTYQPLWSYFLILPFEEIEHTADLAFLINGESPLELHLHAQSALAFKFPSLLPFLFLDPLKDHLDEIIMALNQAITRADQTIGSPIKAISFHGSIQKNAQNILQWEMIIDV